MTVEIAFVAALLALLAITSAGVVVWVSPVNCRVVQAILAARAARIEAYREAHGDVLARERRRLGLDPQAAEAVAE